MHSPLGFWLTLNRYIDGTKSQKRIALSRLVRAVSRDPEAAPMLMDLLRPLPEDHVSELLLKIAQGLDLDACKSTWEREDFQGMMINTIRFYSSANQLIKTLREKRNHPDLHLPACTRVDGDPSAGFPDIEGRWSREKIREALIKIYMENKCNGKAAAERLLTTSADLRLRIFPLFRIDAGDVKRRWILDAMHKSRGEVKAAACRLGISRAALRNKLKKYGIQGSSQPRKVSLRFVDRLPVAQPFEEMYRGTAETTARDYSFRRYCLLFFDHVHGLFNREFRTEEERKNILRFLRQSASRNRRRIQVLYGQLFTRQIPFDITMATRYKFCNSLLYDIFKSLSSDGTSACTRFNGVKELASGDPRMDELILSLKVWALRHWETEPLNWKEYRGNAKTCLAVTAAEENASQLQCLA